MKKQLTLEILNICMQIDEETSLDVNVNFAGKNEAPLTLSVKDGNEFILVRSLHYAERYYKDSLTLLKSILTEHRNQQQAA